MPSSTAEDRSIELRTVAIAFWCLAATATSLRVYVRVGMMKAFTIDDYFMIFAMLSFTANSTTSILGTFYGSGQHMTALVPANAIKAMMFWWACYPTFAVSMVFSKFSVGFFLLRITTQQIHRWIIYTAMGVTLASSTAFFFVAIFQCAPVEFAWDKTLPGACLSLEAIINVTYGYSTFAIITDFTFTLLPAWLVWNLHMDKKTKMALIPILSMACIASCAVAVRLAYVRDFANPDFLWATTDIAIWSQTEQGLAIAAGSFATLRPLFRIVLAKLGLSSGGGTAGGSSGAPGHSGGARGAAGGNGMGRAYYKFKNSNNSSSSSGGGSTSKQPHNSMFSLTTFKRIGDDCCYGDNVEKGGNGLGSSTTELNTPVSPADNTEAVVMETISRKDGGGGDLDGHDDFEYRVSVISRATPPPPPSVLPPAAAAGRRPSQAQLQQQQQEQQAQYVRDHQQYLPQRVYEDVHAISSGGVRHYRQNGRY